MSFNVNDFREQLGAGSRGNLFKVRITHPTLDFSNFDVLCRASSLPSSSLGIVEVPMAGGRRLKVGGDRVFAEWTTTVLNDENFSVRGAIESWQNTIVKTNYELGELGNRDISSSEVTNDVNVFQLNTDGTVITNSAYRLVNCFPSDISTIDLSYDSTDTLEEFTVTWVYDYYVVGETVDANI